MILEDHKVIDSIHAVSGPGHNPQILCFRGTYTTKFNLPLRKFYRSAPTYKIFKISHTKLRVTCICV